MNQRTQTRPQPAATAPGPDVLEAAIQERMELDARKTLEYTPLGCASPIKLSPAVVYRYFAAKTKRGAKAPPEMVEIFLKVCESMRLNPFNRDAWIVGYDANSGPEFSIITSIQSLLKRAEACDYFDGIESGLILERESGQVEEIPGAFYRRGKEKILGAWCKVYRKDRSRPTYVSLPIETRAKDNKFWRDDPGWMITKCAKAAGLRETFPQEMGGLYTEDEMDSVLDKTIERTQQVESAKRQASLNARLAAMAQQPVTPVADTPEPTQEADAEVGDAWEPDEEERAAIEQQLFETHGNAAEM